MNIDSLLMEHNTNKRKLSQHQDIPYTTIVSAFSKSYNNWSVSILSAVAKEVGIGMDDIIKQLDNEKTSLSPFIKWVGGKRQLFGNISELLPNSYNRYYEPFLGGGAVLLALQPKQGVINDLNYELINTWQVVKDNPEELIVALQKHQEKNSKEYYLDIRVMDRDGRLEQMTSVLRAARFIYMNKVGFNGLWRVNKKGQNNVPYGKYKNPNIVDKRIIDVSKYLNKNDIQISNVDYREAVVTAKENDFVYFDSPYIPLNPTSNFTSYNSSEFGLLEQEELRNTALNLAKRGVKVMLSNSDTEITRNLYKNKIFKLHEVKATRSINSDAKKRGKIGELIITTY
ncbi:DNA adenine methylase [Lentilactobacillus kribbianus]|uniref:DNA adenine methylase n=1 Tax=Lentilactobacillus kribbianus TaxID=2729622 RepID=UPI001553B882|nr:DNA adenine methylase [Lentilactobacillus kribbianus]